MAEADTKQIKTSNFFTNERPDIVVNDKGSYGIINGTVTPSNIPDGLTERGAGLGKLGSSMPSPLARLFLFSAAFREVNKLEGLYPRDGHRGKFNNEGQLVSTPYHDLVGEVLDMLEFIFKYGDDPDFHVQKWDLEEECAALEASASEAHKKLASALKSAFDFGVMKDHSIYLFKWKDKVIGGSSPISLVYTSANLRMVLNKEDFQFAGDGGNSLFSDTATALHDRSKAFKEYLYRLYYTDLVGLKPEDPLSQLAKYIQDSASNYDAKMNEAIKNDPEAYKHVKNLQTQGANVKVAGVQLRVSDNTIDISNSGYILKPTVNYYQHGNPDKFIPMVLTKYGDDNLIYAGGRKWNSASDKIDKVLPENIYERHLPGFTKKVKYPFLTVSDLFEDKVIEVSYEINKDKFFTGCAKEISFLLPLKKIFFEYFSVDDLFDERGGYKDMLTVELDEERAKLNFKLYLPLVNGHNICLHKTYDISEKSVEKLDCYDGANTFDFAVFPFYRLEPDITHNVYHVMMGTTIDGVSLKFFEPDENIANYLVNAISKHRTSKGNKSQLATDHIRINGAFKFMELTVPEGDKKVHALLIPIFQKVNSNPAAAGDKFSFSVDFGTTNTHVAYVTVGNEKSFGRDQVNAFGYKEDQQVVVFNNKEGAREFGAFSTALKREFVPVALGESIKFPMRTATYQVAGRPNRLDMFFNTNIGFNYGEDISRSSDYKTNIKWDRANVGIVNDRIRTFFTQILWMMKNKSVLNNGSDSFRLVVTYPISMRANDFSNFKQAWDDAVQDVQCNVSIHYRTESVAPYYSYLADLKFGEPYANMDIGGGTTDILYVNPCNGEANVFSAFFAANDLWNDGINPGNFASKSNGFVQYYKAVRVEYLEEKRAEVEKVMEMANSSADIISYLFANDSWSRLSSTICSSPEMMQLPIIHFSALVFYMAYALHMAELEIPRKLSFTGMGSKYIKLLSSAESDVSNLVNAIFHYAGSALDNSNLKNANIEVSFAPGPKEVTATGALLSLNYANAINPSEDIYLGFEEEEPGRVFRYQDITADVQSSVVRLFRKFTDVFKYEEFLDVLSDMGYNIDSHIISQLNKFASQGLLQMKECSLTGQQLANKLKEPMFFWPLKDFLYAIGKEISGDAIKKIKENS